MKKNYFAILIFSLFIVIALSDYGCNTSTNSVYLPGAIKGRVLDSATQKPIPGVSISTNPSSIGGMTDTGGYFIAPEIPMSSSATTVWVMASKTNYISDTIKTWVHADDTLTVKIYLLPENGVYIKNNVIVQQADFNTSISCINMDYIKPVSTLEHRDIDLRDSANARLKFQFRSSDIDLNNPSYKTKFGYSLGNFRKSDFDTLAMYYGAGEPLSEADFPRDRTDYFYTPLTEQSVIPFYLVGRYTSGGKLPIYGLLYIKEARLEAGNIFTVQVDVKINKNGQNYFLPISK